jgi:uncharacterized protein (TIGR03435 family)
MNRGVVIVLAFALARVALPQQGSPTFEVASVRPSPPSSLGPSMKLEAGGRFVATAMTAHNLITLAFGVRSEDLRNAPSWLEYRKFDINAKPPASETAKDYKAQMQRLRALLMDRFQLKTHQGAEQRRVLALVVAKTGLKTQKAVNGRCPVNSAGSGVALSLDILARDLSQRLRVPVIDKTGLEGAYCIRLYWTSDEGEPAAVGVDGRAASGPSLPTALREQMGLSLVSRRLPVPVLIIDRVTLPTEN